LFGLTLILKLAACIAKVSLAFGNGCANVLNAHSATTKAQTVANFFKLNGKVMINRGCRSKMSNFLISSCPH
jgi:hypothetical protein